MQKTTNLKVAAIQMTSSADLEKNLETADALISQAKLDGVDMVVLPEYFCFMGLKEKDKLALVEKHAQGRIQKFLSDTAKKNSIYVVGGTLPIDSGHALRPFSRCYIYSESGVEVSFYDKIHLFDVDVEDRTNSYRESAYCTPGDNVKLFNTPWGKAGVGVCYDIRFPEMFRQLVKSGCQFILIPAAFTQVTGAAHWHTLLQARAIENQVFVVAAAQSGCHQNQRETYGHSCIISPWGEIIAEQAYGEGVISAELDFMDLEKIRKQFPALNHTRL